MAFIDEQISSGFGVEGVIIKQTLFKSVDVFSAINVQTSSFQNTRQSLESLNQDGRIELGMFSLMMIILQKIIFQIYYLHHFLN